MKLYYTPETGSAGYAFIARCPNCGHVCGTVIDDPAHKTATADVMHGWYKRGLPFERVTIESVGNMRACLCWIPGVLEQRIQRQLVDTVHHCDWLALCKALPDASVDLCLTDSPYGTTACSWDTVIDLGAWWEQMRRVMKPRGAVVMTASQPYTSVLVMSNPSRFRYEWIWLKEQGKQPQMANLRPQKAHESAVVFSEKPCVYYPQFWRDVPYNKKAASKPQSVVHAPGFYGFEKHDQEKRYPMSYLYFPTETGKHPTQKPIALFEYLIRTYTQPGALVFDPFVGSGTTALAARNTGRHYITGDLSAEYVAIARARLAEPYTPDMFTALEQQEQTADPAAQQLSIFDAITQEVL